MLRRHKASKTWAIMYGANTGHNKDLLLSYHEHVIFEIHETMAEKVEVEKCTMHYRRVEKESSYISSQVLEGYADPKMVKSGEWYQLKFLSGSSLLGFVVHEALSAFRVPELGVSSFYDLYYFKPDHAPSPGPRASAIIGKLGAAWKYGDDYENLNRAYGGGFISRTDNSQ
ncbi:hypothetical protein FIE12Z_4630 [Fusarium flagelliforme]|uniref:Uncharacterized protein n=1 Tax=Fusarium flagelliforme TaxID=2675880 RepID=A0A395MTM2_9HYPO|nr:hypothetical protein FIE12Z_4630 [Fusarium flagelliforme]